jgi:hypothetical protein
MILYDNRSKFLHLLIGISIDSLHCAFLDGFLDVIINISIK